MVTALRGFFASAAAVALLPLGLTAQQPAVITGHVTGEGGRPIANASVAITQLGLGSNTREDGSYTILVPAARVTGGQATVTVRAINYRPQTVQVTLSEGSITQDFSLSANPLQLGEVVVTGAGTTSEVSKLGSVRNNVSGQDLSQSQEPSVVNALSAKAPNVNVTASSGDPGSSAFIQIRGPRSYSETSQPLFIIDGQPVDNTTFATNNFDALDNEGPITGPSTQSRLTDVNPADIESVEILKGPAASAIYGARAANGAILITTKAGKAGPTRYTLRSSFGGDRPTKNEPLQRTWGQGRFGNVPTGGAAACAGENASATCFRSWGPNVSSGPTFDHAGELFETGFTSDQTLAISGGNDRTTFYVSGNNIYQNGMVVGSNDVLRRTTVRLNAAHQASDALKVSGNVSYAKTDGRFIERGNNTSGIGIAGYRTPPEFNNLPFLTADGAHRSYLLPNPDPVLDFAAGRVFDNPFFVVNEFQDRSTNQRVFGNVGFDLKLTDWLKLNETVGTDYYNDDRLNAAPINSSQFPTGKITAGNVTNFTIDHNLTATASYKLSPGFAGTFTVGQNVNANTQTLRGTTGRDLITTTPFNLQNTVQRDPLIDQTFKRRVAGYFGQATVDLANQLYLSGAVRYDGSNTFGPDKKYGWFPKVSAAWNFIKDKPQAIISYGKLRTSYGEAAVQAQPYLANTTLVGTSTQPFFGSGGLQGVGLESTENGLGGYFTNLTKGAGQLEPERSKEIEAGIDLGLFGDKADLSFTWYNSQTSNVILNFPLAPSTGFIVQNQNAGKIRNRGVEATLNIRPVTSKNFGWDLGFQFARNRNIVLDLGDVPPDQPVELPGAFLVSQVLQVGQPFGVFRDLGLVKCGLTPSGTLPDLDAQCQGKPTGTLYVGADGFPTLDPNLRIIGDPNPDWTGSARTAFRFGKLTLSGLVDIRNGGDVWNGTRGALYSYGTHKDTEVRANCDGTTCTGNVHTFGKDFWFIGPVTGPGQNLPVSIGENWYRQGPANIFIGNSEDFIEDGGFVRLREVAVQFTLDQPWVRRGLGLSSIDFRLAGRNLLIDTKYTGLDPETNLGQAEQTRRGMDYFNSPQSRSVNFTMTLTR